MEKFNTTQRTTLLFAIILLVLVGAWYGRRVFLQQQQDQYFEEIDFVQDFDTQLVDRIVIDSVVTTELVKDDNGWVVASLPESPPANSAAINALVSMIDAALIQSTVSTIDENLLVYGEVTDVVNHITGWKKDVMVFDIEMGADGSIPLTLYAKRAGDSAVYLIDGDSSVSSLGDWRAPVEETLIDEEVDVQPVNEGILAP